MNKLIDPGHGGHDSGAVSHDGRTLEKDIALQVGQRVAQLLQPHGNVALSRQDDTFVSLGGRARRANQLGADLLSIHCNAGGGRGFEVFTSPGQTASDPWATAVLHALHETFPERPLRKDLGDGDPDKEARFTVLTRTRHRAILVELGFIDTEEGRTFLADPANREGLAQAIAQGTLTHHGIKSTSPVRPPRLTLEERVTRLENLHPEIRA